MLFKFSKFPLKLLQDQRLASKPPPLGSPVEKVTTTVTNICKRTLRVGCLWKGFHFSDNGSNDQFRTVTTQLISETSVVTPNCFAFLAKGSHNLTVTKVLTNPELFLHE